MSRRYGGPTAIEIAMIVFAVVALSGSAALGIADSRAHRACLRAGYPEVRGGIVLGRFCVKRVNQTDVVVPIDSVSK